MKFFKKIREEYIVENGSTVYRYVLWKIFGVFFGFGGRDFYSAYSRFSLCGSQERVIELMKKWACSDKIRKIEAYGFPGIHYEKYERVLA